MKRVLLIAASLVAGVGAVAYPGLSNVLAERHGTAAIQAYAESVAGLDPATRQAGWQAAEEYNQSLTGQPVRDPFLAGTGMAYSDTYTQVLNIDGAMGYLDIPKIRVYLPIYHGTSEAVLHRGIGHLEGSTLPVGGPSRHAVLSGHTGQSHAKLLTDLNELDSGDQFYIHVLGEVLAYQVDRITVVAPEQTAELRRFAGQDLVTLVTCTPYGVNSHRLLVRGVRVAFEPAVHDAVTPVVTSAVDQAVRRAAGVTAGTMAALVVVVLAARRRDRPTVARRALR